MVNIVCMKWGTKFGPHYVNRLFHMAGRNLTLPHRFICLTDNAEGLEPGIESFPLPEIYVPEANRVSPWRKLSMFTPKLYDLSGPSLFLDLDVIIVANIDCFFSVKGKFCIIENWTQKGQGIGNSSVYRFEIGAHADVFREYSENAASVVKEFDNEQIFLSRKIGDLTFWPKEWCRSFKRDCVPKGVLRYFKEPAIPEGAKIVVFHGHPRPDEAMEGQWPRKRPTDLHKFIKPASWIKEYWR